MVAILVNVKKKYDKFIWQQNQRLICIGDFFNKNSCFCDTSPSLLALASLGSERDTNRTDPICVASTKAAKLIKCCRCYGRFCQINLAY
jgi:hypothetical protein